MKILDHLEEWLIAALMGTATLIIFFSGFSLLGGGFIVFVIGEGGLFEGQGGVIDGVVVCFMVVVVGEEL